MLKHNVVIAKQLLVLLGSIIFAPIFGCLLSGFWADGGNTFWKPIDYFPLPVEDVLLMSPFGDEFWVKSNDNKIYHIVYPCKNDQICWDQTDVLPEIDLSQIDYEVTQNACKNASIAYPLFRKIKRCITSWVPNESPWIVSLALTEGHKLWIWQKPWESPYNVLASMVGVTFVSAIAGVVIGVLWAWKMR
jgi:hypothetical protein